ncbi:MAG: hypothetical protein HGA44_06200 [Cellulomonadaceae bacterium]|nr:hypothetical protein [Cellulomonadaceae bacterium]
MKRSKASILLTAALAGMLTASLATSASADSTPQPRDIVGVGSDTSEIVMNYLADGISLSGAFNPGFNATSNARVASFDATGTATVVLKAGTAAITRPNGSGAGKALLYGASSNTNANFARSSSGPSTAENSAGLWAVPYALDGLKMATATTSHAPASLTVAQLVQIYSGAVTNWNQVGGTSGTIVPMLPQTGSGTRNFFLAQLKAANGGVDVTLAASVISVQEHDSAPIAASIDGVAPFSTARFATQATGIKLEGGFAAERAIYNVVRAADLSKSWFTAIFSADGSICSGGGQTLIAAAGFQQLAGPLDGGVCGVPTQVATTNFAVN